MLNRRQILAAAAASALLPGLARAQAKSAVTLQIDGEAGPF